YSKLAAQRVVFSDSLDAGEGIPVAVKSHADEIRCLGELQALARDLFGHPGFPRMIGLQRQVGAEQLMSIAQERLAHALAEERDARDARHRDHQGRGEHAQLAGAPVAPQHAQGLAHATMRPAASRSIRPQRPARLSSCVTITSVVPYSRFRSKSRRITPAPESASRLPVGSSARIASSVDLPEPEAPITATASPRVISRSMSRRMTRSLAPLFTTLPMPFAVTTFLLFMVFACSAQAAGRSILVYGDSLSAAYGISQARGWVALLGERLKRERPDYSVVNASISGETTSGGLARIKPALERHRPAILI